MFPEEATIDHVTITQGGVVITPLNYSISENTYGVYSFSILPIFGEEKNLFNIDIQIPGYKSILYENLKLDTLYVEYVPHGGPNKILTSTNTLLGDYSTLIVPELEKDLVLVTFSLNVPLTTGSIILKQPEGVGNLSTIDSVDYGTINRLSEKTFSAYVEADKDFDFIIKQYGYFPIN
jgi:hypothetical protein